jgi:transcriptional regulator with XRE-family HTH domain
MTPAQCRAARGLIGMSQAELAALAIVPRGFVADFEAGDTLMPADLDALSGRSSRIRRSG